MTPEELYNSHEKYIESTLQMLFGDLSYFAQKYKVEVDDIIQMARIGLWEASIKFDSTKSNFKTYAINHIRWTVLKELRYVTQDIYSKRESERLKNDNRVPLKSFDKKLKSDDDEKATLYDLIDNKDIVCDVEGMVIVNDLINSIKDETNKKVARLLFKGHKAIDIAPMLGVTRKRISQRVQQIRKELKENGVAI
jgi:RNA polymerase sigma factor (sigma-70 family)